MMNFISLVAGAAVAGGAAAYGFAKLVSGSANQDGKRQEILESLKQKLRDLEQKERKGTLTEKDTRDFIVFLKVPLEKDFITAEDAQSLMEQVTSGQLALEEAYRLLYNIISDKRGLPPAVTGSAAQDGKRREILESLKQKLRDLEQKENKGSLTEKDTHDFIVFLKEPLEKDFITAEDAQSLMEQVTSGQLALKEAYGLLYNIISDKRGLPPPK